MYGKYHKDRLGYNIIIAVAILALSLAFCERALAEGASSFVAIIIFILVLGLLGGFYFVLSDFLETTAFPYLFRWLRRRQSRETEVTESESGTSKDNQKLASPLTVCQQYARIQLSRYLSHGDLEQLEGYIEIYAERQSYEDIEPIRTKGLRNIDLYHFGWSIWKYLKVNDPDKSQKQEKIAEWLQAVFIQLQQVDIETIQKKLTTKEKCIIKMDSDISQSVKSTAKPVESGDFSR